VRTRVADGRELGHLGILEFVNQKLIRVFN